MSYVLAALVCKIPVLLKPLRMNLACDRLAEVHRACMAAVLNGALCWHLSLGRAWATTWLLRHDCDTKQFISWHPSRQPNYNRHLKESENKMSTEQYIPHERRVRGTAWCGSNHIFSLIMILTCFVMACDTDASSTGVKAQCWEITGEI